MRERMNKRLSYRSLNCPVCGYALEGLEQPICPECGNRFDSDWLYCVDYEYSFQWTRRRRWIAWSAAIVLAALAVYACLLVSVVYLMMVLGVVGFGCTMYLIRRLRE